MDIDNRYFIALLFVAFILALIYFIYQDRKEEKKNKGLQDMIVEEENMSEGIQEYREQIRNLIEEIEEKMERGESLKELAERCDEYGSKVITGILEVDALLSYKERLCREKGIRFTYEIAPIRKQVMETREYLSLFGNVIDNAIEAAEKCEDRWIDIKAAYVKDQRVSKVVNTKPLNEHPLDGGMATTKKDSKNHGIGSKVIDKIVKDHGGNIIRRDNGDTFEVSVVLSEM